MELLFENVPIHYKVEGKLHQHAIVLLHGFTESLDIWDDFSAELSVDFNRSFHSPRASSSKPSCQSLRFQ